MPSKDAMIATIKAHCRAESELDKEAWSVNFADDAVIEDPVGSPAVFRGIEELNSTFWDNVVRAAPSLSLTSEPIVCGNEAIAILSVAIGPVNARQVIEPLVVHFTFNAAGRITLVRSFFEF